jgi:hypothetical protein
MYWESTLNTNTVRNLADGESFANAIALATDYDSLEDLKTALVTFDNANRNLELIASTELRDVFAQGCCINGVKNVHFRPLYLDLVAA